jgi:hypothetical protein
MKDKDGLCITKNIDSHHNVKHVEAVEGRLMKSPHSRENYENNVIQSLDVADEEEYHPLVDIKPF